MEWSSAELLFASIWVAAFIFVVTYYFCVVNKYKKENGLYRFFCHLSARSVVVFVQTTSIVLGYLGCKILALRYVPSLADITREEWNIFLFTVIYSCSGFLILFGGRIIAKKIGNLQ